MKTDTPVTFVKRRWQYPLIFGVLGALLGVVLRYAYTGGFINFPFKNVIHSHSHVQLLGFLFNALLLLVWSYFTEGIDKISYRYYLALQVCVALFLIAFIVQGYALYSIVLSTLHLWLSYIVLIRLWKRILGNGILQQLVKLGVIFHFIASIGPYLLGPLMALGMKGSPWYQQAIFFYLHFQYFGVFFVWMLAILFKKAHVVITKKQVLLLGVSLVLLFAHSLDYSFDYWAIQWLGGGGSLLLFLLLINFRKNFKEIEKPFRYLYDVILFIALVNIVGSIPIMVDLVVGNRFLLIAWLHLLFLGMYIPFIWMVYSQKIHSLVWFVYVMTVLLSEVLLLFPTMVSQWTSISILWLLFWSYLGVFLCICFVHVKFLLTDGDG